MLPLAGSKCHVADELLKRYSLFHKSAILPKKLALKASPPLLVFPHERWNSARLKLLIVGQETRRWVYNPHEFDGIGESIATFWDFLQAKQGVGAMRALYQWYALGRVHPKLNSPFWRGFRAIDAAISGTTDGALWTNVFKVNVNGSVMRTCKRAEVAALQRVQQGLLFEEIAILKPDVVVFFSGPRYDAAIRCEFPDMEISSFSRRMPMTTLGLVRAVGLPRRTIRTFHPEYLQRSNQLGILAKISKWAVSECR